MAFIVKLCEVWRWPLAFVFALWLFRKPLAQLISRVTRVKAPGAEITAGQQHASSLDRVPTQKPSQRSLEEAIKELLVEFPEEVFKAKADHDKLVAEIAAWRTWWHFEHVYWRIYGSQIKILVDLERRAEGAARGDLLPYYSAVPKEWDYPLDAYLGFLIGEELVSMTPDGRYQITAMGRDFLGYVGFMRYSFPKPF